MPQWIYNFALALWLLSDAFRAGRASLEETGPARLLHWLLVLILVLNAWFVRSSILVPAVISLDFLISHNRAIERITDPDVLGALDLNQKIYLGIKVE